MAFHHKVYNDLEGYKGRGKPRGFWYEVDGEWRHWCEEEGFRVEQPRFLYSVDLGDTKMLTITNVEELDALTNEYHTEIRNFGTGSKFVEEIDWKRVEADGYQGIEIAPYIWERRLETFSTWYYGWDVASGCVWDTRLMKVEYLGPVELYVDA